MSVGTAVDVGVTRILVTGASGFVGRALCEHLEQHGFSVRRALRRAPAGSVGEHCMVGEIGPHTDWQRALRGVDLVVHLAARVHVMKDTATDPMAEYRLVNVEGTRNLARAAAAAGVRRLVFLSSVKVNGEAAAHIYTERDEARPDDRYALSKWEAEQALSEVGAKTGMEWTVLRPPLVYGPGVGANFFRLMQAVAHRRPLPLGAVHNARSLVFVGNLVDAVRICLTHPGAANATFLVRDGEDISTPELARRMARALGIVPLLFPVPVGLLYTAGKLTRREAAVRRLVGSLQVDDTRLRTQLDWRPPFALDEGLRETARWYLGLNRARAAARA
jgi:nucleoside-diphosphate-sugar epimerase